jgi:Ca2+-binding RTX toxin-like protein
MEGTMGQVRARRLGPLATAVLLSGALLGFASELGSQLPSAQAQTRTCYGQPVTILGTEGAEEITGTPGNDIIDGVGGNDTIYGLEGDDIICAGEGDDLMSGGPGDDVLDANEGNNTVYGEEGNDVLDSRSGDDSLDGGPDVDGCFHGDGNDKTTDCEQSGATPCASAPQVGYRPAAACRE